MKALMSSWYSIAFSIARAVKVRWVSLLLLPALLPGLSIVARTAGGQAQALGDGASAQESAQSTRTLQTQVPILPLSEVRAGMRVEARTIFEGTTIEPMAGVVKGVMENFLGPQRDVIVVLFEGEKVEHSGIVHGMSGSPVYIDGKLIGALSLALGPFQKDPLAGVTPIEYMLKESADPSPSLGMRLDGDSAPARGEGQRGTAWRPADVQPAFAKGFSALPWRFLASPLQSSGIDLEGLAKLEERLPGLVSVGGGGISGAIGSPPGAASPRVIPARDIPARDIPARDIPLSEGPVLEPGGMVSALLVSGDASLAASGTLTWVSGDRFVAFGHHLLLQGEVAIPLSSSSVVATVADQTYAYKLCNVGPVVGATTRDQLSGIGGVIGQRAPTIPLRVTMRQEGLLEHTYRFELMDHQTLTPMLLELMLVTVMKRGWDHREEGGILYEASFGLKGYPSLQLVDAVALTRVAGGTTVSDLVDRVLKDYTTLQDNPFAPIQLTEVSLEMEVSAKPRLFEIVDLTVENDRVRPGEAVRAHALIRARHGDLIERIVEIPIPRELPEGGLTLRISDAETIAADDTVAGELLPEQAQSVEQLLRILERRRGDRAYVQLISSSRGAVVADQRLPELPLTTLSVVSGEGRSTSPIRRAVVAEHILTFEGVVMGERSVKVTVAPLL